MKSTKFMSEEEKEKVLKDWNRFIHQRFGSEYFTKRLYEHLTLHCSFIAHFNINGFYNTYFENPENTKKFLQQFDREYGSKSIEYGTTYWLACEDYGDINQAMTESFEPYKEMIYSELKRKTKEIKLKQIEKLKAEIEGLD